MQVLQAMEEQSSQQYVSNLMKGSSNMTLETIARLEKALNLDIIKSALTYVQGYDITTSGTKNPYLNEP